MMLNGYSKKIPLLLATSSLFYFSPVCFANDTMSLEDERQIQENFSKIAQEPGSVVFSPPKEWHLADINSMPASVQIMVVGKGNKEFPPSMNLATESYNGTLKQYLKVVKDINDSQGAEWKDLGTIKTEAGDASLSQVDSKSEWGEIRMMHVILVKNGTVYILTAAALKEEFPKFYKDFFTSMRSLRINKEAIEMVTDPKRRSALDRAIVNLKKNFKSVAEKDSMKSPNLPKIQLLQQSFDSNEFQSNYFEPFKSMVAKDFSDMGTEWQKKLIEKLEIEFVN